MGKTSVTEKVAGAAIVVLSMAFIGLPYVFATMVDPRTQDPCADTVLGFLEQTCPHQEHELLTEGRGFCVCK